MCDNTIGQSTRGRPPSRVSKVESVPSRQLVRADHPLSDRVLVRGYRQRRIRRGRNTDRCPDRQERTRDRLCVFFFFVKCRQKPTVVGRNATFRPEITTSPHYRGPLRYSPKRLARPSPHVTVQHGNRTDDDRSQDKVLRRIRRRRTDVVKAF